MAEPARAVIRLQSGVLAAALVAAILLAALAPTLFPFRPFTRAYYDPWAGVGTVAALLLALLTAAQDRRIVLAGALVAFLTGIAMALLGVLDFNFLRAALALFAVGGIWIGGAVRRAWVAWIPAALSAGTLGLALAWNQMEAIQGQPGMLGAGAALALLTAAWTRHRLACPTGCRGPVGVLALTALTGAGFLLLKEYWVPPVNGLPEQTFLQNAFAVTLAGLVTALAAHWPSWRHLRVLLAATALVLVPSMLGADPEAAFFLPFILVAQLVTVTALFGLGWGLRRLYERGRVAAGPD